MTHKEPTTLEEALAMPWFDCARCPVCDRWQEVFEFGLVACEYDPTHYCTHPARDGDGHGNMVCTICGDKEQR